MFGVAGQASKPVSPLLGFAYGDDLEADLERGRWLSGDAENAKVYRDWLMINIGLHMNLKEKELTGSFPELPADFAAELEKFKAQGVEGIPDVGGEAPLPPMPEPDEETLPEV